VSLPRYLGHILFGNAFGFGHAGVDFFFVLNGFIISYAHAADIGMLHIHFERPIMQFIRRHTPRFCR